MFHSSLDFIWQCSICSTTMLSENTCHNNYDQYSYSNRTSPSTAIQHLEQDNLSGTSHYNISHRKLSTNVQTVTTIFTETFDDSIKFTGGPNKINLIPFLNHVQHIYRSPLFFLNQEKWVLPAFIRKSHNSGNSNNCCTLQLSDVRPHTVLSSGRN